MMSLQNIAAALNGEVSGHEVLAPGPGHTPIDRSLSVKLAPGTTDGIVVHSFAGDDWQGCKDYVKDRLGIRDEWKSKRPQTTITGDRPRVVARYIYQNADGQPFACAVRTTSAVKPKGFYQQHWNGAEWVNGGAKGPAVPYRLPELLKAVHDTVFVVEGEKDADNLAKHGFVATTNIAGAGNWVADLNQYFVGKTVYILADNDQKGADHARDVAQHLRGVAGAVKIVNLPNLPPKGDVSDWMEAGGDIKRLVEICKSAPDAGEAPLPPRLIVSSGEFIAGFVPPDYLLDGMLQRRFCYSLTAPTGSGKTAILLLFSICVADARAIGEYGVEQGRVLYLAGENPDDIRMRWIAMADGMNFDPAKVDVHFLPGVYKLSEIGPRIRAEVEQIGPVSLVVVDTSAAYFEGDAENDNVQMGNHARMMRNLAAKLPGGPCIIIACHPVKNASNENLLPRGGGAFLAEVDGNLTCQKSDSTVTLHWQGKFRGPDFAPVAFELVTATPQALKDSKGRQIPTVIARAMSEKEQGQAEANSRGDENAVLVAVSENERQSYAALADGLGWSMKGGKPHKVRVQRAAKRLMGDRLVRAVRGGLVLTDNGKKEAKRVQYNADAAGAKYG
jgi:hypothetical protein